MTEPLRYDPQPIAKVETAWHAPWMLIGCSQQGPAHYHHGALNADSYKLGRRRARAWLIVADGVGSMPLAYHGSRLATAAAEQHFAMTAPDPLTLNTVRDAFAAAHDAIVLAAKEERREPAEFATTLVAAVLEGDMLVGGAIGDSGIATYSLHGDDGEEAILHGFCSATQSEEPNKTYVITDPRWEQNATFNETVTASLKAVVLATDGADNFYLRQRPRQREPVFMPDIIHEFDAGIAALSARNFFTFFANFLQQHEPDNFDDRTLLVAYRVPEAHSPPPPKPR
jgi:hypothetical protein